MYADVGNPPHWLVSGLDRDPSFTIYAVIGAGYHEYATPADSLLLTNPLAGILSPCRCPAHSVETTTAAPAPASTLPACARGPAGARSASTRTMSEVSPVRSSVQANVAPTGRAPATARRTVFAAITPPSAPSPR